MSKIENVDNFETLKIKINTTCIKFKQVGNLKFKN